MPHGVMQQLGPGCPHAPYAERPAEFRIGLRPIPASDWFEGGEDTPAVRKDRLYAAAPALVWRELEGSRAAQQEALELVSGWCGAEAAAGARPPLRTAARLVSDDLCLMQKKAQGWVLTAASLCAGTFFTAAEAVGQALDQLHAPVPGFSRALAPRVSRIFEALQPDQILERRNWTLVNAGELHLPDPAPMRAEIASLRPEQAGTALYLRIERQTVRKLAQTGAVLFSIRVWRDPLRALEGDGRRLRAFAAAWDEVMGEGGREFRAYKRLDIYDPLVRAFLAAAATGKDADEG